MSCAHLVLPPRTAAPNTHSQLRSAGLEPGRLDILSPPAQPNPCRMPQFPPFPGFSSVSLIVGPAAFFGRFLQEATHRAAGER